MAYARSITTRASLLARRYHPSIGYIPRSDDDNCKQQSNNETLNQRKSKSFVHESFSGSSPNGSLGFGSMYQNQSFPAFLRPTMGFGGCRYMSTVNGEGSEKVISDMAGVLSDTAVDAVAQLAPAVSEVAAAAADSFPPVAALQYVIDYIHIYSGLDWWASIVVATIFIRGATVPLLINQLKSTTKLTIMRPQMEKVKEEMENAGMDPEAMAEGQRRMQDLFKEHGVHPLTPLKGLFIQGPIFISFYLAITNMAEKIPSFKEGGALWFTDLSTPDSLYIFPILAGLTFLITVECNAQEGLEGNPIAGSMKKVGRVFAFATIFFTASFPKAIFCYWVTSNLFSLLYGLVMKRPAVKTYFGVPEIPPAPPSNAQQNPFSWNALVKRYAEAEARKMSSTVQVQTAPRLQSEPPKPARSIGSVSFLNERIKNLERQVKGRKKGKKK